MVMSDPRWWVEYENGDRSIAYDSEPETWAALFELQPSEHMVDPAGYAHQTGTAS
jgi:hypothetical protein